MDHSSGGVNFNKPRKMAFRIRVSKYRHVYGSVSKKDQCFEGVKITKNAHDSSFCAVNPKFIAVVTESGGGGAFLVLPVDKPGRVDINSPRVCGHKSAVLDIKWNPFNDFVLASCSDDATVKVWQIPEQGLKTTLTEWLVDLHGHQRRVGFIEWHPTAENILLSAGYDFKCILWNVETAEPINIINCHTDTIFSISWNREGSLFATTSKDKIIRVIDPRLGKIVTEGPGHQGPKSSKVVFIGDKNKLATTGFTRSSERQIGIWNAKDLSKPLKLESVDSSSGILFPFYDHDCGIMYVAGKGDGNIRYYEIVDEAPYCHFLSQYQSSTPQRGLGVMPKRGIDPARCEIMRFYKLHAIKCICEPISMIVPRKSEMFQDDIFPPTASACPSLTADEWNSGQNREPILVSLKDGAIVALPKTSTSKAVQRKDGALSNVPTITTYKAVKRGALVTNSPDIRQNRHSNPGPTSPPATPKSPEVLPASVKNIMKLSTEDSENNNEESERVEKRVAMLEQKEHTSVTKRTKVTTSSSEDYSVDKRVWSPTLGAGDVPHILPKTDPERVSSPPPISSPSTSNEPCSPKDLSLSPSNNTSLPPSSLPLQTSGDQIKSASSPAGSLPPSPVSPQPKDKVRIVETSGMPPDSSDPSSPCPKTSELQSGSGSTYAPDGQDDVDDSQFNIRPSQVRRSKRWIRKGGENGQIENGGINHVNGGENGTSNFGERFSFGRSSLRSSLRGRRNVDLNNSMDSSPPPMRKDSDMETDDKIHVKKVWSPPPPSSPRVPVENGVPNTDPELRKAYFRQLEEIKSLKEQISLKDHRIRQLEEELCEAKAKSGEDIGESTC